MAQHKADQENGLNLNQHVANQGSVRSMAQAYEQVQQSLSTLSEDERRRLELAYAMSEAFKSGDDDHVVKAFENILHSPYHGFFVFSPEEEDLVAQAERRKIQQVLPSAQEANTQTISNAWFRKLCQLKNLYLQYKQLGRYTEEQIEQWVLADLTNDHYIQEGIEALKKNRSRKMPNPDALLKTEFSAFQASPFVNYAAMSSAYQFSDDEAKAAILMFLRSSVLEGYLAQNNMQMQEWLDTRKRESNANSTHLIGVPEPKRSLLFWWRR